MYSLAAVGDPGVADPKRNSKSARGVEPFSAAALPPPASATAQTASRPIVHLGCLLP
jgi:hypothetical protein